MRKLLGQLPVSVCRWKCARRWPAAVSDQKQRKSVAAFSALILIAQLGGCAGTAKEESLIKRQTALTDSQRLEFDRVFFNEIWLWNQTSWRYGEPPSGLKRQKEFESMAAQGYLPAYAALKMFDFEKQTKHPDKAAFELLRRAADVGDVSSTCALVPIWVWNHIDGYPRDLSWAVPYIERGTAAGHFACITQMAELYRKNFVRARNPNAEMRLLLQAAEQGYTYAFGVLKARLYVADDRPWFVDLNRGMCWNSASRLYSPFLGFDTDFFRMAARGAYPQLGLTAEERTEVRLLAEKWESRMKNAKVIMDVVKECLILEREKLNDNE